MNGDRLLVLPKENSDEVVAIARNEQVESTFETGQFEHLMEQFTIAYEQVQSAAHYTNNKDLEAG